MKSPSQRDTWSRLEAFEPDDPGSKLRFSDRLARENGWSAGYAERVIGEYKRFIYLCRFAGHPVTPSDEVDQAWHLHLCYTRSYWDEMCGTILGAPVHHGPTRGGSAEGEKFVDWYEKTLRAYRDHFCSEPPADIWPASDRRFAHHRYRRVDAAELFLMPRKQVYAGVIAAGSMIALASCSDDLLEEEEGSFFFIIFVVIVLLSLIFGKKGGGRSGGGCSSGCGGGGSGWFGGGDDGCGSSCGGGCGGD